MWEYIGPTVEDVKFENNKASVGPDASTSGISLNTVSERRL